MSQPYLGEIRMFAGTFAPVGWMFCQGQAIQISDNPALYNLIGTTYGGDGQTNFLLPNLASRLPIHQGAGYQLGSFGGTETVTLTAPQAGHNHTLMAQNGTANQSAPAGNCFANTTADANVKWYTTNNPIPADTLAASALTPQGGGQPHDNMPPFLAINFIIAMNGIYPSQ